MRMRRARNTRVMATSLMLAVSLVVFAAANNIGIDTAAAATAKSKVVAKLQVTHTKVDVRKKGASSFAKATSGETLAVGDTVRTEADGRAEIDYSGDAYTRLDVNTTFVVAKLSDNKGDRQVQGSLDTGRTWARTAALTQSESFEQSGAGATSSVL